MLRAFLLLLYCCLSLSSAAQAPRLYINFVSHNEPKDSLQLLSPFMQSRARVLQLADTMVSKGAAWNLGTCDFFVQGALNFENAGISSTDIFETLAQAPYRDHIEVDPRTKNLPGHSVADAVWLLDSCGANRSNTVSGITWFSTNPAQIDWFVFTDSISANQFDFRWKADMIWGAASPGHQNDLHDFGIWKPDSTTDFYTHNADRNLWYIGNGCSPLLDSLDNVQDLVTLILGHVDSLQAGLWPQNGFYCMSITLNQSQFGPMLFGKVSTLIDSVNAMGSSRIAWMKLTEKFAAFETWQSSPDAYSQWACGQSMVSRPEPPADVVLPYPNPCSGTLRLSRSPQSRGTAILSDMFGHSLLTVKFEGALSIDMRPYPPGLYILRVGNDAFRVVKR